MQLRLDERKVCAMALCRIICLDEVRNNQQAFGGCCACLVSLLGLTPSVTAQEEPASDEELPLVDGGAGLDYEVSFSKLRNTDLPGAAAGLAPDVVDLHAAAKQLLTP